MERMTFADTFHGKPQTFPEPIAAERRQRILGTCGLEPAMGRGQGGDAPSVEHDEQQGAVLRNIP